jgi:hypothetical protein
MRHILMSFILLAFMNSTATRLQAQCGTRQIACTQFLFMTACESGNSNLYYYDVRSAEANVTSVSSCSFCFREDCPELSCTRCYNFNFDVAITECNGFEYIATANLCCRDTNCCTGAACPNP